MCGLAINERDRRRGGGWSGGRVVVVVGVLLLLLIIDCGKDSAGEVGDGDCEWARCCVRCAKPHPRAVAKGRASPYHNRSHNGWW